MLIYETINEIYRSMTLAKRQQIEWVSEKRREDKQQPELVVKAVKHISEIEYQSLPSPLLRRCAPMIKIPFYMFADILDLFSSLNETYILYRHLFYSLCSALYPPSHTFTNFKSHSQLKSQLFTAVVIFVLIFIVQCLVQLSLDSLHCH